MENELVPEGEGDKTSVPPKEPVTDESASGDGVEGNSVDESSGGESITRDKSETNTVTTEADSKQKDKDERMDRNARRILSAIIRYMPVITPTLKVKIGSAKIASEVKIPYLEKFSGMIQSSYVNVEGGKGKTLYIAILNGQLFNIIKQILMSDTALRDQLCEDTVQIQFACPKSSKGLLFKRVSKGFLRGKRIAMYAFDLKH